MAENGRKSNEASIFDAARKIEGEKERQAWIEQACSGDAELQSRVEVLLSAHFDNSRFLESPNPRTKTTR